jgi:thymidylate synthase (FAD)
MAEKEPQIFLIGETKIIQDEYLNMLEALEVPHWRSDSDNDTEVIIETAGKMCYMSFDTSLNENLTRTNTKTNHDYIGKSIIGNGHTSVLEHVVVNVAFVDVSRVLTHELVRHRPGTAFSQTSGRYVRLKNIDFFVPSVISENSKLLSLFKKAFKQQEDILAEMVEVSGINEMTKPEEFSIKKQLTSAFRRIIGNGQVNNIIVSFNHRALRHVIQTRTSRHAEEEIRLAFNLLFNKVLDRYPAVYSDAKIQFVEGYNEITFGG